MTFCCVQVMAPGDFIVVVGVIVAVSCRCFAPLVAKTLKTRKSPPGVTLVQILLSCRACLTLKNKIHMGGR